MLAYGSGEFSGTSTMRKPASARTSPTPTTSPGRTPRRIATSGKRRSQSEKGLEAIEIVNIVNVVNVVNAAKRKSWQTGEGLVLWS